MLHLLRFVPFAIVLVWLKYARNIVLQTYLYNHIKYLGGILKTTGWVAGVDQRYTQDSDIQGM